jgi:diguanylate cyclase (GGDEF)-like protein/PAS domain S-box-containing protein
LPASRHFALIFLIPLALAFMNVMRTYDQISTPFYYISLSIGILLTIFLFALNYLVSKPESTSLLVKFSGVVLTSVLAVFGVISWLTAPAYASQYRPALCDQCSILFTPNASGGYDISQAPFQFEEQLGQRLYLADNASGQDASVQQDFEFPFYGQTYSRVYISNNGLISMGQPLNHWDLEYHFSRLPIIFGLTLDLTPKVAETNGVFVRRLPDRLVVTYWRVKAFYHPEREYTFQMVLYTDGRFLLTYNGLPADMSYYVNDRPDSNVWVIGAKPAQGAYEIIRLDTLPAQTGPAGALADPYRAFRQHLHQFVMPLALAILVSSLLFIVGLPLVLHFMFARPLRRLLAGVERFNAGKETETLPVLFNDEIGFLTRSFNNLTGQLNALIHELEARVAERTADLVHANEQLRKLTIAIEQSPSAIVITNPNVEIEYVNPAFTRSTGYTFEEAKGRNPNILKSDQTIPETFVEMWRALRAGQTWRGELINRKKSGEIYWEYTVIAPIYDEQGQISHYVAIKEDVTARKMAEQALQESEKQYRDLFELESDAIFIIRNSDGAILQANKAATLLYGYSEAELTTMKNTDLSAEPESTRQATQSPAPLEKIIHIPLRWHRKHDGLVFPVEINARFISWRGEDVHIAAIRDISEHLQVANAEQRFSTLLKNLNEVTMALSLASTFDKMCRRAIELGREKLGFDRLGLWFIDPDDPESLIGSYGVDEQGNIRDERQVRIPNRPQGINCYLMSDKKAIYYAENAPIYDDQNRQIGQGQKAAVGLWDGNRVIGFLYADNFLRREPIDERQRELLLLFAQAIGHQGTIKRTQQRLEELATTDPLTGLLNRRSFFAQAGAIFSRNRHPDGELAILMLDIDHFKNVNDTYGHQVGDRVLHDIAACIRDNLRPTDLVARYGGEEFVALLPRISLEQMSQIAERLLRAIRDARFETEAGSFSVTVSMGIALQREHTKNLEQLINLADQGLYDAKQAGRDRWVLRQ